MMSYLFSLVCVSTIDDQQEEEQQQKRCCWNCARCRSISNIRCCDCLSYSMNRRTDGRTKMDMAINLYLLSFSIICPTTGDASGPEEDDDEPQTCADQQQPESTTPTTPSADEKIILVSGAEVEEELCDSVVPVAIAATNVVIMPGHQSDETALSQSQPPVHHQQRTSGWKPPAKAQQTGSGYYNANGRQSTAAHSAPAQPNSVNGQQQQQSNGYRRANSSGQRYNGSSSGNGGYNGYNSYGRANSWNTNGSYDHHHSHHHSQQPGGLGKTHGIEKKIFNDGKYYSKTAALSL